MEQLKKAESRITKKALSHFENEQAKELVESAIRTTIVSMVKELPLDELGSVFPFRINNEAEAVHIEVGIKVYDIGKHISEAYEAKLNAILKSLEK